MSINFKLHIPKHLDGQSVPACRNKIPNAYSISGSLEEFKETVLRLQGTTVGGLDNICKCCIKLANKA
jgi:hypothetical protein